MTTHDIAAEFRRPHQFVEFPHGKLAYWCFGDGPDLVFVHGWPLHGATFRRILPALSEHFRCHVFDLPGAGQTSWDEDAPFGLWEHARTLANAVDDVGVEQYGLVAHDSGGTISRLLDTLHPGRVTAHVLGNTEIPGHSLPMLRWAKLGASLPGAAKLTQLAARSDRIVHRMFEGCFADLAELDTDFGEFFVEPLRNDIDYVREQLRLVENLDWTVVEEELAGVHQQITAPVLLIWGERDPWFPWKHAKEMVDSFGGDPASVHLIEDGKLFVHEDFADEFAQVALDFLTSEADHAE